MIGLLLVNSCSTARKVRLKPRYEGQEGEIKIYIEAVRELSNNSFKKRNVLPLTAGFIDRGESKGDGSEVVGTCHPLINEIDISRYKWNQYDVNRKFILIAHEMYHCECLKDHTEKLIAESCPSYMGPTMPSDYCMYKYFHLYMEEIKKGCDL